MRLIAALAFAAAFLWPRRAGRAATVRGVLRISRVVADLDAAEEFYTEALGFERVAAGRMDPALAAVLLPGASATIRRLRLNGEELDLVRWDRPGVSAPAAPRADDRDFQHVAIVVDDMDEAFDHLRQFSPAPISRPRPVTLPGGLRAWKFRDPDGHPLELIFFPPGQGRAVWQEDRPGPFLGLDHSAISVTDSAASTRFYRRLGLRWVSRTLNQGPTQAALDGFRGATAIVTGLRPRAAPGMGVELLAYRPPGRITPIPAANDAATDWLTLDTGRGRPRAVRDLDGHLLVFTG